MTFRLPFLSLCCLLAGCAAAASVRPEAAMELGPGAYLLAGSFAAGEQPDGNSVVLQGSKGLVVVDTGRHAAHTERILEIARDLRSPIAAILNTHWHLDHTGGNLLLRRRVPGVTVYATSAIEEAQEGFLVTYRRQLEEAIAAADAEAGERYRRELALIDAGELLAPDEIISSSARRLVAGRDLEIRVEDPAVTRADLRIVDVDSGVLIAGDLVTLPVPFFDTACPAGWQAALAAIESTEFRLLVPGHGEPMTREEFERYRRGFDRLLECADSPAAASVCSDRWLEDLQSLIPETERPFASRLLEYYVPLLRERTEERQSLCARPPARLAHESERFGPRS